MTSFASREAMTTAEPPEPLASFAINILCFIIESFWQLSARRRGIFVYFVYSVDYTKNSCAFVCIRGSKF